jgi:hypothetical protein
MNSSHQQKQGNPHASDAIILAPARSGASTAGGNVKPAAYDSSTSGKRSVDNLIDDASEASSPGATAQYVTFTIVDDPHNTTVYKGAGSYAATRAETAVRAVEEAFPSLRFEVQLERNLSALHVQVRVHSSIKNDAFLTVLAKALAASATRLAPLIGDLSTNSFAMSERS